MSTIKRRGNQISLGRHWTNKEINKARDMAGKVHSKYIARMLDRSYESLRQMAKRQNISLRLQ